MNCLEAIGDPDWVGILGGAYCLRYCTKEYSKRDLMPPGFFLVSFLKFFYFPNSIILQVVSGLKLH